MCWLLAPHCTCRAEPNAHPSLVPTMCALSAGAFALVAGDQIELKPMKLLIAAVGHDGSEATSIGCRCAFEPGSLHHHLVPLG